MRTTSLLFAVILSFALAGCGGTGMTIMGAGGAATIPPEFTTCTLSDDCTVTVVVSEVGSTSCSVSIKAINDNNLVMKSAGLSHFVSHNIRWVIDDDSQDLKFRFAQEPYGVILKGDATSNQFSNQNRKNGGREYVWRDDNTNNQYYDYKINIIQKGNPNRTCYLDPRIWNN